MSSPVDLVYTWVDGHWPGYAELAREHAAAEGDLNPERFRDDLHLLKYSLRSVEKHAPWIGTVHLLTCRPQFPPYLRRDHPRLKLVHHDEIIDPEFLPTFSCNVIETYLHRLSVHRLLYLNDDFLFGAPVELGDFVARDGRLRVYGTLFGERLGRLRDRGYCPSLAWLEHVPLLIDPATWSEMLAERAEEVRRTRARKFRAPEDLRMERCYRDFLLRRRLGVAVPIWSVLPVYAFHKVTAAPAVQRGALGRLSRRRVKFLCLNDDQGATPHPEVQQAVRALLERWFPEPSSFEVT